ncbi:3-dehydroquinate dehydratase [Ferrovum sp. JA12]|uniref:type II 3-dehydroquinate dehydratase n=1 Tax=Ferrovum sp. JA12 TaxID=1356299 RepID=UPI000702964D|nr:type II 3-dehydroquinate dehydratase [Ferrovum sp. JA12]KRH79424.1 3-dehydroquinate dehydratase [Ferrovum sp. JA12]
MKKILIMHGPNLNLLGTREPDIYGKTTLEDINCQLAELCQGHDASVIFFQSNWEGALIDRLHHAKEEGVDYIIVNPGGLTHTSVSLRDALAGIKIPFIEVHLSNIYARESFRSHSYLSPLAEGVISGLGAKGYHLALTYWLERL